MQAIHLTCKYYGIELPFSKGLPHLGTMLNSPQQDHGTLDYGVAVLYAIRQYFRQQPIVKKEAEKEIRVMCTEIIETLD